MSHSFRNLARPARAALAALILAACSQPAPAPTPAPQGSTPPPSALATPTATAAPASTTSTALPAPPAATAAPTATAAPELASFFDDQRLFYAPGFYTPEIQALLDSQPGALKNMRFSIGGRRHTLAEVIIGQTSYYGVNPQIILALLESQAQLLSDPAPSSAQLTWAVGFDGENGNWGGLQSQIRWAVRQAFYARRDYPSAIPLRYATQETFDMPASWGLSQYVIARLLAPTTTPGNLTARMERFQQTYARLFGDPRLPPEGWPAPAAPFMRHPVEKIVPVTSFFDHDAPFLTRDPRGSVMTYWGRAETDNSFAYDGHDGWDYAAAPPDLTVAAADGLVVFAGNADDGCATRAVVVDHENGYRTLYWHLARIDVEIGQRVAAGEPLGVIGESGCALGPHLHFGTQYLGRSTDPYGWCGAGIDPWEAHPSGTPSRWLWRDRPTPCGPAPAGAVVVDTQSPGFARSAGDWQETPAGYGGGALFSPSIRGTSEREPWRLRSLSEPTVAVWQAAIPASGRYRVLAYIPYALSGLEDPRTTAYRVRHADGEAEVVINARTYANDWADLGTYTFSAAQPATVVLSNQAEENRLSVWADAIIWIPEATP